MSEKSKPDPEPVQIRVTDRRPRLDGSGESGAEEAVAEARRPTVVVELEERARAAEAKLNEALDLLRRREAEAEESRSRLGREMERRARSQVESFLQEFLPILDSLDRGLASVSQDEPHTLLREGLDKVRTLFLSILSRQGVEPMDLEGTPYDPGLAEAVAVAPVQEGGEEGVVLEEISRGYTWEGKVLRPAQVRVSRNPAGQVSRSSPPEVSDPDADSPTETR